MHYFLQAKLLKVKVLIADKEYESAIAESGFLLKEDENNLEALLLRGRAYYYLADHEAQQFYQICNLLVEPFGIYYLKNN